MSKVIFDFSMSLDGFITASNRRPEEPMGDGGQRLHEWAMGGDERNREFLERSVSGLGAAIGRQYIAAGLVDEIVIHLVPVLFGGGTRMFENFGGEHIQLETTSVMETPVATHLGFRVVK
jgi:hypothetical protein